MPETCDAGHGCIISCPGDSCWAIYWHDIVHCDKGCCDEDVESIKSRLGVRGKGESKVNFCAKGMELSKIAVVLDTLLPDQIAIPPAKAYTKISTDLKEVSITEVVKSLGLLIL